MHHKTVIYFFKDSPRMNGAPILSYFCRKVYSIYYVLVFKMLQCCEGETMFGYKIIYLSPAAALDQYLLLIARYF